MNLSNGGIISVVDLWSVNGALRGADKAVETETVFGGRKVNSVVAGSPSATRLRNPAGSGLVLLVDKITVIPAVTEVFNMSFDITTTWADSENGFNYNLGGAGSVGVMERNAVAFTASPVFLRPGTANEPFSFTLELPLLLNAGDVIGVYNSTNTATFTTEFLWREYAL